LPRAVASSEINPLTVESLEETVPDKLLTVISKASTSS
jgi:hypothetical protein